MADNGMTIKKGSVVCLAPGQVIWHRRYRVKSSSLKVMHCVFHPDLIRGTNLGRAMSEYTLFFLMK